MDFDYSPIFLLISFLVSVSVFVFFKTRKPNPNLPPGPRKLPLIGNLHLLAGSTPPHQTLSKLSTTYGPLMHLQLGQINAVVASSPETAAKFLKTHDVVFSSRPSLLATEINCYGNSDIAFSPYGNYWRQLRKICTLHLLSPKRVESFRRIREEEALNLCKCVAQSEGTTINLTEIVATTDLNIMVRAAFGRKSGEVALLQEMITEGQESFTVFNVVDVFPSLKLLRVVVGRVKEMIEKHHLRLDSIMQSIIDERRQRKNDGGGEEDEDEDLLDVLLRLQGDGSLEIPLTMDNIKAVLLDGSGVDSSTTTINWAMVEMLKNPRVLAKAQEEVRRVFDDKDKNYVDERYFVELNYLKLVIKETLRLHTPAPLLLPRESRERCEINGYEIPAKTWILVNAWGMGRNPNYWEDAECFKPERFIEKPADFNASRLEYIPFGAGRRICPGIAFGMANVEMQLAMLLYHFDWILPKGIEPDDVDMTEVSGVSGRRKCSLCVVPIARRAMP